MAGPTTTETLLGLPILIWSGIVAAGMTLLGTVLGVIATNWGNTKRLNLQLEHDATEKARERLVTLRRELYLKAVDANIRGFGFFGSLPQADFSTPDVDAPLRNVLAIGAQLQLVVNQGTAQLISDLISAYGELQFKLMAKVLPIHNLRFNIKLCNLHYDNFQIEIKRLLAAMTQYNESGQHNPEAFSRLNDSLSFAKDAAKKLVDERSEFWNQSNALHRQYMKDLLPELKHIGGLQTQVLVELRRELDVGGDIEVFQRIMRNQMKRAERAMNQFDTDVFGGASGEQPT